MELRLRRSSSTDKVFVLFSLCSLCSPWFKFQRTIAWSLTSNHCEKLTKYEAAYTITMLVGEFFYLWTK